ncbi:MAG: hypothetical protein SGI73_07870 [Chloroflexota bacterium]|nr:hypothetical protein [Chloroflexota bacterium]
MSTPEQALEAQSLHEADLLAKPNVVGVAVGFKAEKGEKNGDIALIVLVEEKKPLAALTPDEVVPREVEGLRTDVYEVGYLRALQTPSERYRPIIPGGVSIGHYKVTAGTLATVVKDRTTGELFLLSNNHVFAHNNDALVGDAILQPAAMDGGLSPADIVAKLERFLTLRFLDDVVDAPPPPSTGGGAPRAGCDVVGTAAMAANAFAAFVGSDKRLTVRSAAASEFAQSMTGGGLVDSPQLLLRALAANPNAPTNRADCALARPVNPAMFSDDIKQIGMVTQTKTPSLGMRVGKHGRTTGYTEGNVTLLNATVNIAYNTARGQRTARFVGQVIVESMSEGGDSGALVVDPTDKSAVGLLFAGSPQASIFTPIDVVLSDLNIIL